MTDVDPVEAMRSVRDVVLAARGGAVPSDRILAALLTLRSARDQLGAWEPELIAAARDSGASWTSLAPVLGVASRQAAERRFLRLQPSATGEETGEARVHAERDRRAGDRAVAEWARRNASVLRQLAGRISALEGFDGAARETVDRLVAALGDNDVTNLLPPLAAVRAHLARDHPDLADRLGTVGEHTARLRRNAVGQRHDRIR
ncbi:HSP18 transcriptional regulator [Amycolatopsis sp., V23-08]|uniref:HSP18 transcriptional regulator n=1 Tax=Amycolatopsis heterodermiae TaxID=3110235 RepID=A0ABU5RG36_9PSEU|nr:HSP18 transcriptional regulator [Amycolatopsis sp., V23-08]MEA5365242.1 HSP18 transcriptional regulator [Amycolatopsis sp., V23-08]